MIDYNNIGIVGMGMVGGTLANFYPQAKAWDKYKDTPNTREEVLACDVIFLCIYIKDNGSNADFATIMELIDDIPKDRGRIIISKMTTVPGFTERLAAATDTHHVYHSPEFLTEASADFDFKNPPFQILGYTDGVDHAFNILNMLPSATVTRVVASRASELFKIVRNSFLASKVILANQTYDLCEGVGVGYNVIQDLFKHDAWIGGSHSTIWHKGDRGFGGKCLPKDLDSLIKVGKDAKVNVSVFKAIKKANDNLRR